MKEFNNLITDSAKRERPQSHKKVHEVSGYHSHRQPERLML